MTLTSVDLGKTKIDVPVFDIVGKRPGKTVLVTAGMDGDEYASIEACYRLIDRVSVSGVAGRLIIIPIVNTPGFWSEQSPNPMDGTYPKFAGVGKINGSPTQRLVHWLVDSYAKKSDLWLDLHGGTRTETMANYLWAWETKVAEIDIFVKKFINDYTPRFGIFEQQMTPVGKAATLARMGCAYIQGEAGGSGLRREKDIHQHEMWITAALTQTGVITSNQSFRLKSSAKSSSTIYSKVDHIRCHNPGLWYPASTTIRVVRKGEMLGSVRPLDGKKLHTIYAPRAGQLLWIKDGLRALPTDGLIAIGYIK